jgi:ABC-2 type transport system ATP-binding protein
MNFLPLISLKHVSKSFKKNSVIEDMNLNIYRNDILLIIGRSGCGKSTLFKMLVGIYKPDEGEIFYSGSLSSGHEIQRSLKKIVGFVSQENSFYESLTPLENFYFFGKVFGLSKKEIKRRAEYLLHLVNLYYSKDVIVERLSGGMKRRLEFALSLIHDPEILILDEPFTGLDLFLVDEIWKIIKKVRETGVTIILSSHDLKDIDNNIYFFGDNSQRALLLKETLGTKYDVHGISGNFAVSFNVTNYVNAQNHESNQLGFNVVNALSDRFRISNDTDIVVANYSNLLFSMSVEKFLNEIRGKESNSYDDIGRMDIALRNDLFFGVSHNNSSFKTTMGISLISDFQTESVLYQKPKRYSGIGSYAYIEKPLFEDYTINVEATQKRFAKTQQDFLKLGIKTGGFEINAGNIKVNYDNDFVQNFIANVNQTFVELKNKNFSLKLVKDEKDSLDDNYKVNVNYSAKF